MTRIADQARLERALSLLNAADRVPSGVLFYEVWMTRDLANWLLENAAENRNTVAVSLRQLRRDMAAHQWPLTPEALMIGVDGRLFEGKHRVLAYLEAEAADPGLRVPVTIAVNVADEVRSVIDLGRPRSAAHIAQLAAGSENASRKAAIARMVLRYDIYPGVVWTGSHTALSRLEIARFVMDHDQALQVIRSTTPRIMTRTSFGALAFLVTQRSAQADDRWTQFVAGLQTGVGLPEGDPRLLLRMRSGGGRDDGQRRRQAQARPDWGGGQGELGELIKAWNAYVQHRPMKLLRFNRTELPMPKPL